MNDEEEVKETLGDGDAMPNLDDAFEEDSFEGDDDLGVIAAINEEEEDFDTDFLLEDRDGNY